MLAHAASGQPLGRIRVPNIVPAPISQLKGEFTLHALKAWHHAFSNVTRNFARQTLIVALCLALLACFVFDSAAHGLPVILVLFQFGCLLPFVHALARRNSSVQCQPHSFLSLDSSRAHPSA